MSSSSDDLQTPAAVALARSITARLPLCSHDELRVLDVILERVLKVGRQSYAPLVIARETRDWRAEGAAELADFLFYAAAGQVAADDTRLERLRCEAADEMGAVEVGLRELVANAPDGSDRG